MEAPFPDRSRAIRHVLIAGAYLLAWTLLDVVAAWFETAPEISIWYPPSALDVALLLLFGVRYWPALLLNTPLHVAVVGKAGAFDWASLLAFNAATTVGYAGAGYLLVRVLRIDPGLRTRRDVMWFIAVAVFAAPMFVAAGQVANLTLAGKLPGGDFLLNVLRYFAGDATGVAMLAPCLLVLARRFPATAAFRPGDPQRPGSPVLSHDHPALRRLLLLEAVAFCLAVWAAFGWTRPVSLDFSYLLWLPMLWVALRYGFERTTAFVFLANSAVVLLVASRFNGGSPIVLQFGLLAFTVTGLLAGAVASDMARTARRLQHQATHDDLTGLPNRVLFRTRIAEAVRRHPKKPLVVAMLDLDDFRDANNSLGHPAGNALLHSVGQRLLRLAGPGATVARVGGDEFGLALPNPDGSAADVLHRILRRLPEGVMLGGVAHPVTASAGASVFPGDEMDADKTDADKLIEQADLALYRAKDEGRAALALFQPGMAVALAERLGTERELRQALERGELVLHFQPQVTCGTRRLVGAEALVRWAHPTRGLLAPHEFLPFAETAGLMGPIGSAVLFEACRQAAAWPDGGLSVSVNVAPAQWREGHDLPAQVREALEGSGLAASRLRLEVTEEAMLRVEEARSVLELLDVRALGVGVSMDDFGTGHSSLSRLRRLPVDEIKVDQAFVAGIGRNGDDEAIVRSVVALGHALNQRVVAEGVETDAQLRFLHGLGCELAQGYLFSRPLDAGAFRVLAGSWPFGGTA